MTRGLGLPVFDSDRLRYRAQIDLLASHSAAGYARKLEEVVDELRHALATRADAVEIFPCLFVETRGVIFQQRLRKAVDPAQGRPQIMRNRIAKCFELVIRHFELRSALPHSLFQFDI